MGYNRACEGMRLKVIPGSYNETLTLSKRLQLSVKGQGTVVIGATGR
jgi:hypothetical protein